MNMRPKGAWVSVRNEMPSDGEYWVVYYRNGHKDISKKKLISSNGASKWFGGCRPFSENDIVTHWLRVNEG